MIFSFYWLPTLSRATLRVAAETKVVTTVWEGAEDCVKKNGIENQRRIPILNKLPVYVVLWAVSFEFLQSFPVMRRTRWRYVKYS